MFILNFKITHIKQIHESKKSCETTFSVEDETQYWRG